MVQFFLLGAFGNIPLFELLYRDRVCSSIPFPALTIVELRTQEMIAFLCLVRKTDGHSFEIEHTDRARVCFVEMEALSMLYGADQAGTSPPKRRRLNDFRTSTKCLSTGYSTI
jgi:hypothetical protein